VVVKLAPANWIEFLKENAGWLAVVTTLLGGSYVFGRYGGEDELRAVKAKLDLAQNFKIEDVKSSISELNSKLVAVRLSEAERRRLASLEIELKNLNARFDESQEKLKSTEDAFSRAFPGSRISLTDADENKSIIVNGEAVGISEVSYISVDLRDGEEFHSLRAGQNFSLKNGCVITALEFADGVATLGNSCGKAH
jgi:hypothetical protein